MLRVGIPKEIKALEKRVGLVPAAVEMLCKQGVEVYVEKNAGRESGFSDQDYERAGAQILSEAAQVYGKAQIIQKVKEPLEPEFQYFRKGLIVFGFMHLASPENAALISALVRSEVTAIGYETVEKNGRCPLLAPMSEIAGALSAAYAAVLTKQDPAGDVTSRLEKAAALYPGFKTLSFSGSAVIFGGGVAGTQALKTILRLGGQATVIEKDALRRESLKELTANVYDPDDFFAEILEQSDVLIGSVHARGAKAFRVLTVDQMAHISRVKRKVIFDIAIDQGGNFPESRSSSYLNPVYKDSWGNDRFCVPNIPSLCGRGASVALSQLTVPYTQKLVLGFDQAFRDFPELAGAVNVEKGILKISALK